MKIIFLTFYQNGIPYKAYKNAEVIKKLKLNINIIKNEMDRQGLKPADLARIMNVKDQWIYSVLSGESGKTFKVADQFAQALGLQSKDIVEN